MPAWSDEIAATFVRCASERQIGLEQLQLQALVYIAHGWRLALTGEPLTGNRPVVARFGPEYERIAHALRGRGLNDVRPRDLPLPDLSVLDVEELDLITSVVDTHGSLNASQLATITRDEQSPWCQRIETGLGREIGHNEIRRQFEAFLNSKGDQARAEGA